MAYERVDLTGIYYQLNQSKCKYFLRSSPDKNFIRKIFICVGTAPFLSMLFRTCFSYTLDQKFLFGGHVDFGGVSTKYFHFMAQKYKTKEKEDAPVL